MTRSERQVLDRFLKEMSLYTTFYKDARKRAFDEGVERTKEFIFTNQSLINLKSFSEAINETLTWAATKLGHNGYLSIDALWRYLCLLLECSTLIPRLQEKDHPRHFFYPKKSAYTPKGRYSLNAGQAFFERLFKLTKGKNENGNTIRITPQEAEESIPPQLR